MQKQKHFASGLHDAINSHIFVHRRFSGSQIYNNICYWRSLHCVHGHFGTVLTETECVKSTEQVGFGAQCQHVSGYFWWRVQGKDVNNMQ